MDMEKRFYELLKEKDKLFYENIRLKRIINKLNNEKNKKTMKDGDFNGKTISISVRENTRARREVYGFERRLRVIER